MPLLSTIPELILEEGNAKARGVYGAGQAWGQGLANLGKLAQNYYTQGQEEKRQQLQEALALQQKESNDLLLQKQRDAAQQDKDISDAVRRSGDLRSALPAIKAKYPVYGQTLESQFADYDAKAHKNLSDQNEEDRKAAGENAAVVGEELRKHQDFGRRPGVTPEERAYDYENTLRAIGARGAKTTLLPPPEDYAQDPDSWDQKLGNIADHYETYDAAAKRLDAAAKEAAAATNQSTANATTADKWLELGSRYAGGVADQASLDAYRKTMADLKAPPATLSQIPTKFDAKTWPAYKQSFLTEQQRQANAIDTRRLNLQQEAQNAGAIDTDDPKAKEAIEGLAQYVATTYSLPSGFRAMGKNGTAFLTAIFAKAAEIQRARGVDPAAVAAQYKANASSLTAIQKNTDAVQAFMRTADSNVDLLEQSLKGIPDLGAPILNAHMRDFTQQVIGDPRMSSFRTYLQSVQNEYARIITTPGLGGVLSDSARHEAEELLRSDATVGQALASIRALKNEGTNRVRSQEEQINQILGRINAGGASATTVPPEVNNALVSQPPARYTLKDGSVWDKYPDGTLHKVK